MNVLWIPDSILDVLQIVTKLDIEGFLSEITNRLVAVKGLHIFFCDCSVRTGTLKR